MAKEKPAEKRPRVMVEVPGYWALPPEDRERVDELMKQRAQERDAKKPHQGHLPADGGPDGEDDGEL